MGLNSYNILYQYELGDGNDLINGFNATSTLSISGGMYSSEKIGDDVIVTIEYGDKITLQGAATLSSVNIIGKQMLNINNNTNDILIEGTDLPDVINNHGGNVTVLTILSITEVQTSQ